VEATLLSGARLVPIFFVATLPPFLLKADGGF
jgi:hypothetical protein